MCVKAIHFFGHRFGGRAAGQRGQGCFQLPDDFDRRCVFELLDQRLEPGFGAGLVVAKQRPAHGGQRLDGMVEVQALAGLRPAVVGQAPDPHGRVGAEWMLPSRTPHARPARPRVQSRGRRFRDWEQIQGRSFSCPQHKPPGKKLRCAPIPASSAFRVQLLAVSGYE